jgi:hypothetical protein
MSILAEPLGLKTVGEAFAPGATSLPVETAVALAATGLTVLVPHPAQATTAIETTQVVVRNMVSS